MGHRRHHKRHRLITKKDRRLLFLVLLACMTLGLAINLGLGWFSPSTLKEKAAESFLMQYLPKDMERGEFLKKRMEATKGMDKEEVPKIAKEYLKNQKGEFLKGMETTKGMDKEKVLKIAKEYLEKQKK